MHDAGLVWHAALANAFVQVKEAPLNASRYASLQVAYNAMPAAGGEMYAPAGTYAGDVVIPPQVKFRGAGREAVQISGLVPLNAAESSVLEDVTINIQTKGGNGLVIQGAHRASFSRINISSSIAGAAGTGLSITANGTPVYHCEFDEIETIFNAGGGRGVYVTATGSADWITACNFRKIVCRARPAST